MIKFFRKIRQKLLAEGRLSKYLIYALGEIILVVVGILIALQINNWNEEKKNILVEHKILQDILKNLVEDQETLETTMQRFWLTESNINKLLMPIPIPDDSLIYISTRAGGFSIFIPITSAFDRSMSSSSFNLIRKDSLAEEIQRLYNFDYHTLYVIHEAINQAQDDMLELNVRFDAFSSQSFSRKDIYDREYSMPFDLDNLKKRNASQEFKSRVKQVKFTVGTLLTLYDNILQNNLKVQESIKSYLTDF